LEKLNQRIKNIKSNLFQKEEEYDKAREDIKDLELQISGLASQINEIEENLKSLENDLLTQENQLNKDILKNGFSSITQVEESLLEEEELFELKDSVKRFNNNIIQYSQQKLKLEQELSNKNQKDMFLLEAQLDSIKKDQRQISNEIKELEQWKKHNEQSYKQAKKLFNEISEGEELYKVLGELASVAKGRNPAGITFERYVLASFLEEIIIAANTRLKTMTLGRYQLFRSQTLERKNQQSGLDLEVLDSYTGKMRHVKTLSGGESFKAALAMALGLSEVVQSYAGGVDIQTMFIDEGFGTLDPESLDSAIECLMLLQSSGRKAGIISHVPELKERFSTQLQIISSTKGSTTKYVR